MRQIAPNVHVAEAQQRFMGIEVGARMTVLELEGGLLIHSPIAIDPKEVAKLGEPRWVIAPNLLHHLYIGPWIEAGVEAWAPTGLPEKREDLSFDGVLKPGDASPFGHEVEVLPMTSFAMTNEIALLHRPSKTLLVTDLLYNFPASAPWTTRAAMRCLCGYPGCTTSLIERFGMKHAIAREEIKALADWDFDRIIMAHGDVLETGGKDALREGFRWLGDL